MNEAIQVILSPNEPISVQLEKPAEIQVELACGGSDFFELGLEETVPNLEAIYKLSAL